MAERRDRSADIHMKDGVLRKGRVVGHSDASGRIREADSALKRGEELGYIDEKHRIRRKGGLFRRGEVVGRIRGNAVFGNEGLLSGGKRLGYVDEHGNIWQAGGAAFRGRVIGKARGADPEAALAYFVLKFQEIEDAVATLEEKVQASQDKYAYLPRLRAMQRLLPEVDAIGDFDDLVQRLDGLEEICAEELGHHFREGREKIVEAATTKPSPESIVDALRAEWRIGAIDPIEHADMLVGRVRGALGALSEGRLRNRGDHAEAPRALPATNESPEPSELTRVEALVDAALGPVDKLRDEIDRIRKDPEYGAEELVDRVRSAMTSLLEVRDMATRAGIPVPRLPGLRSESDRNAQSTRSRPLTEPPAPARSEPSRPSTRTEPPPRSTSRSEPAARAVTRADEAPARPKTLPPPASTGTALARVGSTPPPADSRALLEAVLATKEANQVFELIDRSLDRLRELDGTRRDAVGLVKEALVRLREMDPTSPEGLAALQDALARLRSGR